LLGRAERRYWHWWHRWQLYRVLTSTANHTPRSVSSLCFLALFPRSVSSRSVSSRSVSSRSISSRSISPLSVSPLSVSPLSISSLSVSSLSVSSLSVSPLSVSSLSPSSPSVSRVGRATNGAGKANPACSGQTSGADGARDDHSSDMAKKTGSTHVEGSERHLAAAAEGSPGGGDGTSPCSAVGRPVRATFFFLTLLNLIRLRINFYKSNG
jgi:hypothetical protein